MVTAASRSHVTLQMLVGAAERLSRHSGADDLDWLALVEVVRDRLLPTPFQVLPVVGFYHNQAGKRRLLTKQQPPDRLLAEAIRPILEDLVEVVCTDSVHSYRQGRSTYTAAWQLAELLQHGLHFLLLTDIQNFFPSVDRTRLLASLRDHLDSTLCAYIEALLSAPIQLGHRRLPPPPGLPLGNPLSPALANLYLAPLDQALSRLPCGYLRYGDDLLLAAVTESHLNAILQVVDRELHRLGLKLHPEKRTRLYYDGRPIPYLGHMVAAGKVYDRIPVERLKRLVAKTSAGPGAIPPGDPSGATRTLYIAERRLFVHIRNQQICCRRGKEIVAEVPLRLVNRIVIMSGISLSSGFLTACARRKIQVLFFFQRGRGYGSLVPYGVANPLRLRAQYDLFAQPDRRRSLAQSLVATKIEAQERRLKRTPSGSQRIAQLRRLRAQVSGTPSFDHLRGIEGQATAIYYGGFAERIRVAEFAFVRRSKRPPRDPINSLLSFTYALLFGEMQTALLVHGLDPYPGILHELRKDHPALASDLIEPYRHLIGDTFVLTLVNQRIFGGEDFRKVAAGGVYLNDEARPLFLHRYEQFMRRPLGGPTATVTPRQLLHAAARAMLAVVLGEQTQLSLPLDRGTFEPHQPDPVILIGDNVHVGAPTIPPLPPGGT